MSEEGYSDYSEGSFHRSDEAVSSKLQQEIESHIKMTRDKSKEMIINDDGISPFALLYYECNCGELLVAAIPFATPEDIDRDLFAALFYNTIKFAVDYYRTLSCRTCGSKFHSFLGYSFTSECWTSPDIYPSESSLRQEAISTFLITKEVSKTYIADIKRYENKVEIGTEHISIKDDQCGRLVVSLDELETTPKLIVGHPFIAKFIGDSGWVDSK